MTIKTETFDIIGSKYDDFNEVLFRAHEHASKLADKHELAIVKLTLQNFAFDSKKTGFFVFKVKLGVRF